MQQQWKIDALSLISIALALLAFINKEDRLIAAFVLSIAITFYVINSFSDSLDTLEERTEKMEEKIKIYSELINMKSNITYLKREVTKK